jgi:beta-ketoacyl-acyl-carrier-protein synthase II
MERFSQFAVAASLQAAEQARLKITDDIAEETGVIIGNIICGMLQVVKQLEVLHRSGPNLVNPILAPIMTGDAAGIQVTLKLGAKGPNYALSSACCSGLDSIGLAYDTIRHGEAKVMIAGGSEAPLTPIAIAAFNAARLLSTKNGTPANACRPFDAERDGFVLGEGAAILVMEELDYALERGAPILAEVVAYSANSDAFHMTQPSPEGKGGIRALNKALKRAGIGPEEVDYINAYGAATILNDKTETEVIKSVFGEHAYQIPISATKSMTGHLLGAAGSTQVVVSVMALNHGLLPPTINLHNPDPECDLDYIPNEARQADIKTAICNSFGFGGHNTVLVLRKFQQ